MNDNPALTDEFFLQWFSNAEMKNTLNAILTPLENVIEFNAHFLLIKQGETLFVSTYHGVEVTKKMNSYSIDFCDHPDLYKQIQIKKPQITCSGIGGIILKKFYPSVPSGHCLQVPLIYYDQLVGILLLIKDKQKHTFTKNDGEIAFSFCNQAAFAIENKRLFLEAQRRAIRLEIAGEIVKKVSSILDLDHLLSEIVKLIQVRLGYSHVHIFLVDENTHQIVLQEISGEKGEMLRNLGLRLDIGGNSITGWVASSRSPLVCNDISKESRYYPHKLLPDTKSEMAIPIQIGKKLVGVLDIQSNKINAFQANDLTILQIVAGQVGIAIENAYLFQKSREQVDILSALHNISLNITSKLESEQVLDTIMKQAVELLKAQGSSLGIYYEEKNVIRIIASFNVPFELKGVELEVGEGVAGQVIATQKPVFTNDYETWDQRSLKFEQPPYNAVLGVPLFWEDRVIGELVVLDRTERRKFTSEDANLLSLVADLASIAIKNSELFDTVKQSSEKLEQTVARRTAQLSEAQTALANKAEELRRLLEITVNVQEEERARIALDIHDGTNQLITGTLFEIQAAQQSIRDQRLETSLEKLETAKKHLRLIESENRKLISGLRPIMLDTDGLIAALRWHTDRFEKDYHITCLFRVIGNPFSMPQMTETAIYRIVQESLNNIAKHSGANQVNILADYQPEGFYLVISDDGIGFEPQSIDNIFNTQMGIIGMKERAQSIKGNLNIQSQPGEGTQISLKIPSYHQLEEKN